MKNKFQFAMTLAVILAMVLTAVALASSVDESIVDATAPTGSVTLNPGGNGAITINLSVTGRQDNPASFDVYTTWTLSGGTFTGSNPQTFNVPARAAKDPATTFSTSGTVNVDAGQSVGTFTLSVGAFNIVTAAPAALAAGTPSSYVVKVEIPTPTDTAAPNISCTPPTDLVWYGANVSVPCTASDTESGLANSADASFSLSTSVASGTETATAQTNSHQVCDKAGNCANAGPYTFMVDKKAPQFSSCDSPDGNWHNANVTLNCTYTDGGSGAGNLTVALTTSVADGNEDGNALASANGAQACDAVGNCADSPTDIPGNMVDKKAPTVSCGSADGLWHATDQSVTCTATDSGSGPASQTVTLSTSVADGIETNNASTNSQSVSDAVGNTATAGPVSGFMIDKKAPAVSCGSADGLWHATDQSVTCTAADGGSGPASQTVTLSTSVADGTETNNATTNSQSVSDAVGNTATAGPVGPFKIDRKAPSVSVAPDRPVDHDGWYNHALTITFSGTDGGSGLASCDPAVNYSGPDSASVSLSGSCWDKVGNAAGASFDFKYDATVPTIDPSWMGAFVNNGEYYFGFLPAWPPNPCVADDNLSGVASCAVPGGLTTVGTHTLTATAYDNAGNTVVETLTYKVLAWDLRGFYSPVDMNGVFNVVKGGSTVPLKFEVFAGTTELTLTSVVKSFIQTKIACDGSSPTDEIEFTTTGGTSLRYDATAGQFIQNWQTPKLPGACYRVTMTTWDLSTLVAYFKLK